MDKMLSIGKVADMMGVTVQTLRYYDNIGLVTPAYSNPETNYRYYSPQQLHFIDRIKYLQRFGISLDEIKTILIDNDISLLLSSLDTQKERYMQEIQDLKDKIDDIEWYRRYFTYTEDSGALANYYCQHREQRYILAVKIKENETRESFHMRLNQLKSRSRDLPVYRQFFYVLNYESFMQGKLDPKYLGFYLKSAAIKKEKIQENESVLCIPEGEYFSFKSKILSDEWDTSFAKLFFEGKRKPAMVIASEYENSLCDYSSCVYEVEIPIS